MLRRSIAFMPMTIMVTAPIGICADKPAVMAEVRQAADKAVVGRYDKDDLKVRDFAVQPRIIGQINLAHSALAEL